MFPFVYSPTFEYPLSGDITQGIALVSGDIEGIPEVEHEVVTSVASYGKQLGKLTDTVLALADAVGLEGEVVDDVREITAGVEAAKGRAREAVRERAVRMTERAKRLGW